MTFSMIVAFATYLITMTIGIVATVTKRSFGKVHHVAFFVSWIALIWACVDTMNMWLLLPAVAMVLMPRTKAGSKNHTLIALAGLSSWLVVGATLYFHIG